MNVEQRLAQNGWDDRACAIVPDPELEVWVWQDSAKVEEVLLWQDQTQSLREWLRLKNFWNVGDSKPARPKEALEAVRKFRHIKKSSSLFKDMASKVSFQKCTDRAFQKLVLKLQQWFPAS